ELDHHRACAGHLGSRTRDARSPGIAMTVRRIGYGARRPKHLRTDPLNVVVAARGDLRAHEPPAVGGDAAQVVVDRMAVSILGPDGDDDGLRFGLVVERR